MGKKIVIKPETKCLHCGLDCQDEISLKRHKEWTHKDKETK